MKVLTILIASTLAATTAVAAPKPPPKAAAPSAPAKPAAPAAADWRTPNPDDVLVIDTNKGRIIVEMVPEVAPLFTDRMRELAQEHFFDGLTFFRVIDDFMDQTGDPQNNGMGGSTKPDVKAEFQFRRATDGPFTMLQDRGVDEVVFLKAMPLVTQSMALAPLTADGKVKGYALYCPGVAGAARGEDENSANSQFFLMRAAFPKLERRYTAFGRVIAGQDVVRQIKTGEPVPDPQDRMERLRLLSDIPEKERPKIRVIDTAGKWFKAEYARVQAAEGANFSPCDVNIPVEVK
jgi:peptidylprolyl isomerase